MSEFASRGSHGRTIENDSEHDDFVDEVWGDAQSVVAPENSRAIVEFDSRSDVTRSGRKLNDADRGVVVSQDELIRRSEQRNTFNRKPQSSKIANRSASHRVHQPPRDSRGQLQQETRSRLNKPTSSHRSSQRHKRGQIATGVFWLNIAIVVGLFVVQGESSLSSVAQTWGAVGRLSGLVGTFIVLVQIMLIARTPFIERIFGFDKIVHWHARLGRAAFTLITIHAATIIAGYAGLARVGVVKEAVVLSLMSRDMLMAVVAFALFVLVATTSVRIARKKLKRETWFFVHLYSYAAVALSVPHVIALGADFKGHVVTQLYWGIVFALSIATVLIYRIGQPLLTYRRHDLRVAKVVYESNDVVSLYISGKRLEDFTYLGGQFFIWRFLARGQWHQAHPYSVSSVCNGRFVRITVKALGDGSSSLFNIAAGTRVIAEGPYGIFTTESRSKKNVVLIAGGVGVTPVRALLASFKSGRNVTFLYRARSVEDAVLHWEIEKIARRIGARFEMVLGKSSQYPPDFPAFGPDHLAQLVPNIANSDVFVCGPGPLVKTVVESCDELGVAKSQMHYESFEM